MKIKLEDLDTIIKSKPDHYFDECLSKVKDDVLDVLEVTWGEGCNELLMLYSQRINNKPAKKIRGLGDIVSRVAQPIARVIDKISGTKISQCGGCQSRREALNKMFPIK